MALDLLESSGITVSVGWLNLMADPATDRSRRRLHVEIPCGADPITLGWSPL
jgi:hypothetical protein